jgi:hypothetical protein
MKTQTHHHKGPDLFWVARNHETENAMGRRPMDALEIKDLIQRQKAWETLAKTMHEAQGSVFGRGKNRFNVFVSYDSESNRIQWNGKPLEGSFCWRTNLPQESLCPLTSQKSKNPQYVPPAKVCLVLMVKNESKIIKRLLESLIDEIDAFVVLDTGSTDDTREQMWDFLVTRHHKPGVVYQSEWYDFGTNRSIVSQLAFKSGQWLLLMDADYILVRTKELRDKSDSWKSRLPPYGTGANKFLLGTTGDLQYSRPHIVAGDLLWTYYCRTHEFIGQKSTSHTAKTRQRSDHDFPFLQIDHVGDGGSKFDKGPRDIVMLLMDMMDEPLSERAYFYAANTAKGMGMYVWARELYEKHRTLCAWEEELSCASEYTLECQKMGAVQSSHLIWIEQINTCLDGCIQNPARLETLFTFLRQVSGDWNMRHQWIHVLCSIGSLVALNQFPHGQKLFVRKALHDWEFWRDLALVLFEVPIYFSLGCYIIQKLFIAVEKIDAAVVGSEPVVMEEDKKEFNIPTHIRTEIKAMHKSYRARAERMKGPEYMKMTSKLRKILKEKGIAYLNKRLLTKASHVLLAACQDVVERDLIDDLLLVNNDAGIVISKATAVPAVKIESKGSNRDEEDKGINSGETAHAAIVEQYFTEVYHARSGQRLSSWKNLVNLTTLITEADRDRADCCCLLAEVQKHLTDEARSAVKTPEDWTRKDDLIHDVKLLFWYFDALKYDPENPIALSVLNTMFRHKPKVMTEIAAKMGYISRNSFTQQKSIERRNLLVHTGGTDKLLRVMEFACKHTKFVHVQFAFDRNNDSVRRNLQKIFLRSVDQKKLKALLGN